MTPSCRSRSRGLPFAPLGGIDQLGVKLRAYVLPLVVAGVVVACGGPSAPGSDRGDSSTDFELIASTKSATYDDGGISLVATKSQFADAWQEHGFAGEVPEVDFDSRAVLLFSFYWDDCLFSISHIGQEKPGEGGPTSSSADELEIGWEPEAEKCLDVGKPHAYAIAVERDALKDRVHVSAPSGASRVVELP